MGGNAAGTTDYGGNGLLLVTVLSSEGMIIRGGGAGVGGEHGGHGWQGVDGGEGGSSDGWSRWGSLVPPFRRIRGRRVYSGRCICAWGTFMGNDGKVGWGGSHDTRMDILTVRDGRSARMTILDTTNGLASQKVVGQEDAEEEEEEKDAASDLPVSGDDGLIR